MSSPFVTGHVTVTHTTHRTSGRADAQFDDMVGAIQDILFEDSLSELQRGFFDKHYHHFDNAEENKFIYTDIFKEYVSCC